MEVCSVHPRSPEFNLGDEYEVNNPLLFTTIHSAPMAVNYLGSDLLQRQKSLSTPHLQS